MTPQQSGVQREWKGRNVLIVGVAGVVALLSGLSLWMVKPSRTETRTKYPPDMSSTGVAGLSRIQDDLLGAFDELTDRVQVLEPQESKDESFVKLSVERWREFPRTRVDLVNLFLSPISSVHSNILVRHEILNVLDVPLGPDQISSLDLLVTQRAKLLDEMMHNYQLMRNAEMLQMIRKRRVEPIEVPAPSDSLLRAVSKTIAKIRTEKDGSDAQTYHEILSAMRKSPPPELGVSGNYIKSGGRIYMFQDFPEHLPLSDPTYEVIITLSIQFLNEVLVWFESRGLTRPVDIDPVFREATFWTPAKQRRDVAPKGRGRAK